MLAKRGYTVACGTGKDTAHDYLRRLGADEILSRETLSNPKKRPLLKMRWAGAVDPVGGETLSYLLSTMKWGGSVALSGLAGGPAFSSTVFPFILRGINLLGIDSAHVSHTYRQKVWNRLATDLKPEGVLDQIVMEEVTLEELPDALSTILKGGFVAGSWFVWPESKKQPQKEFEAVFSCQVSLDIIWYPLQEWNLFLKKAFPDPSK